MSDQEKHALKVLDDSIQRTYNRIQYDRTLSAQDRQNLKKTLDSLEDDKKMFFASDAQNFI